MPISGDFAALAELRKKLATLDAEGLKRVSKQVHIEAKVLAARSFQQGTSPDGVAWAPLRVRSGQPLRDSGRLATSLTVEDTGSGFVIATNVDYAEVHQRGATIKAKGKRSLYSKKLRRFFGTSVTIPARPFLPVGDALPASWVQPISETIDEALELFFG